MKIELTKKELAALAKEGAVLRRTALLKELDRINAFLGHVDTPTNGTSQPVPVNTEKVRAKKVRTMSPEARAAIGKAVRERWAKRKAAAKKKLVS